MTVDNIYDDIDIDETPPGPWTIAEQRLEVFHGLKTSLVVNAYWEPISKDWMLAWKEYTGYGLDNANEVTHYVYI